MKTAVISTKLSN